MNHSARERATPPFVHLNVHSEFSLVDGIVRIKPLVAAVAKADMPAVGLTDHCNLFAAVRFYSAAVAAGVKPLIGCDLSLANPHDAKTPGRVLLHCQDQTGYRNLTRLVTRAYAQGQTAGVPIARVPWLEDANEGLIALSGGRRGEVGHALAAGRVDDARRAIERMATWFPERYYLELHRTGRPGEEAYLEDALTLAAEFDLPVVATNDVRFIDEADFDAHEARVCIHESRTLSDPRRVRRYSEAQFLRSPEQMYALFADLPEAVENTIHIARRCNLELELGKSYLPDFPVPPGHDAASWMAEQAGLGLERRLERMRAQDARATAGADRSNGAVRPANGASVVSAVDDRLGAGSATDAGNAIAPKGALSAPRDEAVYRSRLKLELDVIAGMGFPGYFLIVADFIQWARDNDIPVGPGRGSGAGSLVAYALSITDIDPLQHDLLFERFLNPERVSLPDFDIDFCMDGRDRVIDYVAERYGAPGARAGADDTGDDHESNDHERVAQIITFGTMAAKAVVRDVGRVLGHGYGFVDELAKLIPNDLGITLAEALAEDPLKTRYKEDEEARILFDLARKLEGIARNAGRHAGGVVIAPGPLTDFTALYREQGSTSPVTQYDKNDVEAVGLVKFDFLGLRTLTIIDRTMRTINAERRQAGLEPIDINALPMEDPGTYELIRTGRTTAVFQLESSGMQDLIRRLKPDCFDDLVALVALFRPGPLQSGMVDDFIERKQGRAKVEYPHPDVRPLLESTYGVILYQEQVMQIAQVLSGYSLGGADLLRRAMGKKDPEAMAKQRQAFVEGARAGGVDENTATQIFNLMEKFAGYGFNKSHSAAYALLTYQTGWLKRHYPAAFMSAVLSADMDQTDKVVHIIEECRSLELEVLGPDVNRCDLHFTPVGRRTVRYGLGAIKGVGEGAIAELMAEREANGEFTDLFDFCCRIDTRKLNRRALEGMVKAGALDVLAPTRAACMATLTPAIQAAEQVQRDAGAGQNDMFGGTTVDDVSEHAFANAIDWSEEERLAGEKQTLGLYLTGHPIARFEAELEQIISARLADIRPANGATSLVAGFVVKSREIKSRRGRMAVVTLDDRTARVEVVVYAALYADCQELLKNDRLLVVEGEVSADEFSGGCSIIANKVQDLDSVRATRARWVAIRVQACSGDDDKADRGQSGGNGKGAGGDVADRLAELLAPHRGGRTPVCIEYVRADASARLELGREWCVKPSSDLLSQLETLAGEGCVSLEY